MFVLLGGFALSLKAWGKEPRLVATFSILGDVVRNVAGEAAQVTVLIGPNGDPHVFEPSPSALRTLAAADIVFKNGLGLEPWLESALKASGSRARVVDVSVGVPVLAFDSGQSCSPGCSHKHGEHDPHIWQNPRHMMNAVRRIRDALDQLNPQAKSLHAARAAAYIRELEALDREIATLMREVPPANRRLVTNHNNMAYFAQRYGFRIFDNVLQSPTTDTADPSPATIARLAKRVHRERIPAIFAENTSSSKLAAVVAREAGVTLVKGLHTDALGEPGGPAGTYLDMMRHNARLIHSALTTGNTSERLSQR